jgi:carbon storage regulator
VLVLSRQRDQAIVIGDDVEVYVIEIRGDKVRLGINAPQHVAVDRQEIRQAQKREAGCGHTLESLSAAAAATRSPPAGVNRA